MVWPRWTRPQGAACPAAIDGGRIAADTGLFRSAQAAAEEPVLVGGEHGEPAAAHAELVVDRPYVALTVFTDTVRSRAISSSDSMEGSSPSTVISRSLNIAFWRC
jgi:hypothetical protein